LKFAPFIGVGSLAFENFSRSPPLVTASATTPDDSALGALQQRLGYTFRDVELLRRALTHPSYTQDHPESGESNQRLEFLGDAVIQLTLTEALFTLFPEDREGPLTKRRAALTRGTFLCGLARELDLPASLRVGASEEQSGGRFRDSSLEDAFEAMIGALYLDGELGAARRVLLGLFGSLPDRLAAIQPLENPKGRLQELIQGDHGNHALRYASTHIAGEDHAREYEAGVWLYERRLGTGRGTSKRAAEEAAARVALETLLAERGAGAE
jgi:ribonuclease-3